MFDPKIQSKSMEDNRTRILIDQNLFNKLTCGPENTNFRRAFQKVLREEFREKEKPFISMACAFSFLESLGLNLKHLGSPNVIQVPRTATAVEQVERIIKYSHDFYENRRRENWQIILTRAEDQEKHIADNEFSKSLFEDCVVRLIETPNMDRIISNYLSHNFVQLKSNYHDLTLVASTLIALALKEREQGWDISMFRLMNQTFPVLKKKVLERIPTSTEIRKFFESFQLPNLKTKKDLFDTELVHYAIMGVTEEGVLNRVAVFTCDPDQNELRSRIRWAKGMYSMVMSQVQAESSILKFSDPLNGMVFILNQSSGNLENIISVTDVDCWYP